jgi:uncharacterized membrane protein YeaQ/YmgE (transglycosylase-associated protein family)
MAAAVLPLHDLDRVVPEKKRNLFVQRHRLREVREKIFDARPLLFLPMPVHSSRILSQDVKKNKVKAKVEG